MRILYLHQYFVTPSMAGGTRSYEMARRWVAAGHEVNVVTSRQRPASEQGGWSLTTEAGVNVHWYPVPYSNKMSFARRLISFARFAAVAGRKAIKIGGDIVFATSTPLTIALPAIQTIRSLNIPMVFEVRDLWPELPIAIGAIRSPAGKGAARWLERRAYMASAAVIALSPGMADGVARTGFPRDRIHVIPNSSDIDLFQGPGEPLPWDADSLAWLDSGPVVLYAGTLGVMNGVGYLVDVAAAAAKIGSPLRFLVVGNGAEEQRIRDRAAAAGVLGNNFRLLTSVSKVCMPTLLARAAVATSLFIDLPEMWNNSANKFFDALAAGKAVAINYRGWHQELLESSGAGLALPYNDPTAAASMLTDFVLAPGAVTAAGAAALELARERFDRDLLAQELLSVLDEAANKANCVAASC